MNPRHIFLMILGLLVFSGCAATKLKYQPPKVPAPPASLPNLREVHPGTFTGGQPAGSNGFHRLRALGIETVISVDGARPDVKTAAAYGIRYIHIPIGYGGINDRQRLSLIRAAEEVEGPRYIHCHHGRHRAPAAAAFTLMATRALNHKEAKQMMLKAGTSLDYDGLWESVKTFVPRTPSQTLPELEEVARPRKLASAMAELDRHWDDLKQANSMDWIPPATHPDMDPIHTSLLVHEALVEAQRLKHDPPSPKFGALFEKAVTTSRQLNTALKASDPRQARSRFMALKKTCTSCHTRFRD